MTKILMATINIYRDDDDDIDDIRDRYFMEYDTTKDATDVINNVCQYLDETGLPDEIENWFEGGYWEDNLNDPDSIEVKEQEQY